MVKRYQNAQLASAVEVLTHVPLFTSDDHPSPFESRGQHVDHLNAAQREQCLGGRSITRRFAVTREKWYVFRETLFPSCGDPLVELSGNEPDPVSVTRV